MYDYFYGAAGNHFNYFQLPEDLVYSESFRDLSSEAKLLYSIMLRRVGLSFKNGWADSQGKTYIIITLSEVMEIFHCANQKATKVFNELEEYGLIERARQGQGRPNLVYVKDFASSANEKLQTHANHDSRIMKTMNQDSCKSLSSYKNMSNTDSSEINPILSGKKGMDERKECESYFRQSLEFELLLEEYPHEQETLEGILELLIDTCCSRRVFIRVSGDDKPKEVVKGRLMKLDSSHIRYVLQCLKENTSYVRNMKQFLLASLYNAAVTISPYYQSRANFDLSQSSGPEEAC